MMRMVLAGEIQWMAALQVLLALAILLIIGLLVFLLVGRRESAGFWTGGLGFGVGTGLGLQCLGMFYLAYWRIQLNLLNIALLSGGAVILLAFVNRFIPRHPIPSKTPRLACPWTRFEVLLAGIAGVSAFLVLIDAISQPLIAFDARSIWGMKSKILFFQQGIYGQDFVDPARLHAHQQYPLLVPLAETFVCRSLGRFDDRWEKAIFPGFFVGLIFLVYFTLRHHFGRTYSLAGVAMLSGLPVIVVFANGGVSSGYADIPLAYYLTAFAIALWFWIDTGDSRYLWLASLLGVFTLFTKNEGTALWGIAVVGFALLAGWSSTRPITRLLHLGLSSAATVLMAIPWFHLRSQLVLNDENYPSLFTLENFAQGMGRAPYLLKAFLREFYLKPHLWNILGLTILFAIFQSKIKTWRMRHSVFFFIPALYCLLLALMFLITPWRVEDLLPISLSRLLTHTAPLLLLWLFFRVAALEILPSDWTGASASITEEQ